MGKHVARIDAATAKRYALYVRVSDAKQLAGRDYTSLESQEGFLRRWAADRGGEVFKLYTDTESGTLLEERGGLMSLLADAQAGRFDVAAAYNADRWCRSLEIHTIFKRIERETGVRFLSATQEFSDGPEGELLEGQIACISQYFSRVIGAKVRLKRRMKAERGEWNGGRRPYGYTSERAQLIVVPEEAEVVRQIFALYLEHPSATTVKNRLRALGVKDRRGKWFSNSSVECILANPVYGGFIRGADGGDPVPGVHQPLVDAETWETTRKTAPTRQRRETKIDRVFPLVGLLRCGACDALMTLHYVQKRDGQRFPRYRCTTTFHYAWKDCPIREVNADRIEAWVAKQLQTLAVDGPLLDGVIAEVNTAGEARTRPLREEEAAIGRRIEEVRAKVDNLVAAIADGAGAFPSVRAKLTLEERNLRLLDDERAKVRAEIDRLSGEPIDAQRIRRMLADFDALYAVASPTERKELLRLAVRSIVFRGEGQEVTMQLTAEANLRSDRTANANLDAGGSILRAVWLRRRDSNTGPGD